MTASRTKPRMREISVMLLIVASARNRFMAGLYGSDPPGLASLVAQAGLSLYTYGLFESPGREGHMANTKGARKAARQSQKRRTHNISMRSTLRTAITRVKKAIEAGDKAKAQQVYRESVSVMDSIADKKIIHKNKASRHKSRLAAHIKALA